MIPTIFALLEAGLSLWNTKEKQKYIDKYLRLKEEWFHEYNKPDHEIDDNVLSNIEWELKLLCNAFSSSVRVPDSKNK